MVSIISYIFYVPVGHSLWNFYIHCSECVSIPKGKAQYFTALWKVLPAWVLAHVSPVISVSPLPCILCQELVRVLRAGRMGSKGDWWLATDGKTRLDELLCALPSWFFTALKSFANFARISSNQGAEITFVEGFPQFSWRCTSGVGMNIYFTDKVCLSSWCLGPDSASQFS